MILLHFIAALWQVTGNLPVDRDTLEAIFKGVLFTGAMGGVVKVTVDWIAKEWGDDHGPISPKTKRRLTYLVSIVEPTLIYLLYTISPLHFDAYHLETNLLIILGTFGVSQIWHGEADLPNGQQMKRKTPTGGSIAQPLEGTVYVAPNASVIKVGPPRGSNITEGV